MIRNYFKVAFRSIFRNKLTAFINMAGLALAMTCALLIYLYISDEVSYDRYNHHADRIYRVTRDFKSPDGTVNLHLGNVAPPIGPLLKNDFGEIETLARTINFNLVIGMEENGELTKNFTEERLFVVEPDIFKIFDINVLYGDPSTALTKPFTVMLSEKTALKYFDDTNVTGQQLRANNAFDLEVTGVYKDFPDQAHWHPELLVSFATLDNDNIYGRHSLETNWGNNAFGTYFLLEEGADPGKLEAQLPGFLDKHFGSFVKANWGAPADLVVSKGTSLYVQKVTDIHLHSHLDDEVEVNGNINNVYMMGVIGLFILLIACFNFVNLATARATKRAKEVGLRKVVGALRQQLVVQYLSESVLMAFFAMALTLALGWLGLDWLNQFTSKGLSFNVIDQPMLLAGLACATLLIGLLAGIYPAFIVSGFKPALTLKGQHGSATGKGAIRKILVVSQFSISIVLLIATAITIQQLDYLNKRNLGFDKDQVVTLPYYRELAPSYDAFYNELLRSSAIKNASRSSRVPTGRLLDSKGSPRVVKGDSLTDPGIITKNVTVDEEFFPTYGIKFIAGRNFSKSIPTDTAAFVINETAAREYGFSTPGEGINKDFSYGDIRGKLIGVVKDFHFESLHQNVIPMVFHSGRMNIISIKMAGRNRQDGIAHLEKVWKEFVPARPFEYNFLDERYRQLYEAEQKQSKLFSIFSGLAIFIACLGLFGLATFNTLQRVKEIGIRKVLGASVPSILTLLSKEIVILIIISNVMAWPIAGYFMNQWLDSFAYHIVVNWLVYVMAGLSAVAIALLTVSTQTIKAAMANPSDTLRYE